MLSFLDRIPLVFFIAIAASLGMAPFFPEPHIWEKLKMLFDGSLSRPVDIFDFVFHGAPWVLLTLKLVWIFGKKEEQDVDSSDERKP